MLTGRDKVKVVCCLLQAEFGNLFFVFNFAAQWRPSGRSVRVTSSDNTEPSWAAGQYLWGWEGRTVIAGYFVGKSDIFWPDCIEKHWRATVPRYHGTTVLGCHVICPGLMMGRSMILWAPTSQARAACVN